jgi:hypothetical protein
MYVCMKVGYPLLSSAGGELRVRWRSGHRHGGCYTRPDIPGLTDTPYIHTYIPISITIKKCYTHIHTYIHLLTVFFVHLRCESLVGWVRNSTLVIQHFENTHTYTHTYIHRLHILSYSHMYVCMYVCM